MRPNWGSISINALILVVAFIVGYAIHGGPKNGRRSRRTGQLQHGDANIADVQPERRRRNELHQRHDLQLHAKRAASRRASRRAQRPKPSACPAVGGSGCFVIGGQMQSLDAAGLQETVNLTETLDFQSHKTTSLAKPAGTITTNTPPPGDGNPVGFHAAGRADVRPSAQFKWPPPCLANQTCSVTIDLKMPSPAADYKCSTSYCLSFSGKSMASQLDRLGQHESSRKRNGTDGHYGNDLYRTVSVEPLAVHHQRVRARSQESSGRCDRADLVRDAVAQLRRLSRKRRSARPR